MTLDEALEEILNTTDGVLGHGPSIRAILLRYAASVRDEALEEAAKKSHDVHVACDSEGRYCCAEGKTAAQEIRALKAGKEQAPNAD